MNTQAYCAARSRYNALLEEYGRRTEEMVALYTAIPETDVTALAACESLADQYYAELGIEDAHRELLRAKQELYAEVEEEFRWHPVLAEMFDRIAAMSKARAVTWRHRVCEVVAKPLSHEPIA